MELILKWFLIIMAVIFMTCGIEGSCLTLSRLSCTDGSIRGLGTDFNRPEIRLIPGMQFNCNGTLVGLTVSGRNGSGTAYPKLQIWRRNSTNRSTYYKNGPEIEIDAKGSACEAISVDCNRVFHCRLSPANFVSILSYSDIIGVELPPLNNQAFELLFTATGHGQRQYVWRQKVNMSSIIIGHHDLAVVDDLFLSAEVLPPDTGECFADSQGDCDQICTNTTGSFQCNCIDGYTLSSNGRSCQDINECTAGTHNCQQHCINTHGGFLCDCNSGYQLNSDGRNCRVNEQNLETGSSSLTIDIEALVGGLFGTMLLVLVIILLMLLIRVINERKRNSSKTANIEITVQRQSTRGSETTQHEMVVRETVKARVKIPSSLNISSTNLRVADPIGQGEFGIVYKGYSKTGRFTTEIVAIKTLKGFIDKDAIQELLSECAKMKSFNHPHVMNLKGVCLDGGPAPYLILPYMANGSLLSYLRKKQSSLVVAPGTEIAQSQVEVIEKQLLDMCLQVAKGMEYLACEKVVHRDLAARNCMIDMNLVIKVSDFGLSVNMGDKEYYRLSGDMGIKLPFRWMAPETFSDYIFSEKSDIWSYGVTCWEIFTGGQVPYTGIRPTSLQTLLQRGERLETPNNSACSSEIYSTMRWCWEMTPDKRPSFSTLVQTISTSLEDKAGYLRVGAFVDHDATFGKAEED